MRALIASLFAVLAACSSPATRSADDTAIWDVKAQRFVSERELVDELAHARYRLLGEIHDDPAHHEIRARLVRGIAASGARPAVVFEQFDLANDAALRSAQRAGADAEGLAEAGRLDRAAWRWPLHAPIVQAALDARLPVRAANLSRQALRSDDAAREGSAQARLAAARWNDAQQATLTADIVEGHCGKLPPSVVPRLVEAQRVRDATIAQALVDAASADGAILIAGNGHVRGDIGVPVYLHARGLADAGARSVSVGFLEAEPGERRSTAFAAEAAAERRGFDYLVFTAPVAREDPCAQFALPPARK